MLEPVFNSLAWLEEEDGWSVWERFGCYSFCSLFFHEIISEVGVNLKSAATILSRCTRQAWSDLLRCTEDIQGKSAGFGSRHKWSLANFLPMFLHTVDVL